MVVNKYTQSIPSRLIDGWTNRNILVPFLVYFADDIYYSSVSGVLDLALMAMYIMTMIIVMWTIHSIISFEILRVGIYWGMVVALHHYGEVLPIIPVVFCVMYTMRALTRMACPASDRTMKQWDRNTTLNMGIADEKFKYLLLFAIVLVVSSFAPTDSLLRGAPVIMVGLVVLSMSSMFGGNSSWTVITIVVFMAATVLVYPEMPFRLREIAGWDAIRENPPIVNEPTVQWKIMDFSYWLSFFNGGFGIIDIRYTIIHAPSFYALQCLGIFLGMYLAVDSICGPDAARSSAIEMNKERNNRHGDTKSRGSALSFTAIWVLLAGIEVYLAIFLWGPIRCIHHVLLGIAAWMYWKYVYGRNYWVAEGENTAMNWVFKMTAFLPGPPPARARYIQVVGTGILISLFLGAGTHPLVGMAYLIMMAAMYKKPNMMVAIVALPTMQLPMLFGALVERADMDDDNPKIEGTDTKTKSEDDNAILWDMGGNCSSWFHVEVGKTENLRVQKEKRRKRNVLVDNLFTPK